MYISGSYSRSIPVVEDAAMLRQNIIEILEFKNQSYPVSIPGNVTYRGNKKFQVGWAELAMNKFLERIIFKINGGRATKDTIGDLKKLLENAAWFGNGTIIFDRNTGDIRVANPTSSYAYLDSWGRAEFVEEIPGSYDQVIGVDGELFEVTEDGEIFELNSAYFSVFWNADENSPFGRSRLVPAARVQIHEKSSNLMRRSYTADKGSYPQMILNGLWEDVDPEIGANAAKLVGGTSRVIGLPKDPDTGEKIDVEQLEQVSPDPLLRHDSQIARDFGALMNVPPGEIGEASSNPPSKEAMDAMKESLILEVRSWEQAVSKEITAFLFEVASYWDEEDPVLGFANPAVISLSASMDMATKANSVWPGFHLSRAAAAYAGLPEDVIAEMFDSDGLPFVVVDDETE